MCDPVTMSVVAIGIGAFGAKTSYDQGKFQEKVMKNNALSAKYAADDALARGAVEEGQARDRARAVMGAQRAALAANGLDATTGTGSQLLTDTAGMAEFDALTVRNNAMKQAYGLNVQSTNLLAEGRAAKVAGTNAAIGSLLTAGSQAASIYGAGAKPSGSQYNYANDASGRQFSATGADVRARR